jgi:hypothetical protein
MINDDRRDLFHRWEVMKSLEALQQGQKTESVLIGLGAALCELSLPLRGVNDCFSSLAVTVGLNRGYAVRSADGKILLHACFRGEILKP